MPRRDSRVTRKRRERQLDSDPFSRKIYIYIYITRGYWRAFLTPTEYRYHDRCSIVVCSFAMPSVRYRQEIVVTFETTWRGNGKRIRYAARPLLGFVQKKQKKISVYSRLSLSLALFYAFHSLEAVEEKARIELQEGSLISKDRLFFFKIALCTTTGSQ